MKYSKQEKEEAIKFLEQYRGQNFACCIKSVSRSGMSRRMEFYAKDFQRIGYYIARVIDYPYNVDKGGIQVNGCGMDMVFHVLSSLNYAMARIDTGKTIPELLETKECGIHIYDEYFTNANRYTLL